MNVDVKGSLQPLRIRYAEPAVARLRAFWSWWSGELYPLLPQSLRDAIDQRRQKLYVEADGATLRFRLGANEAAREVLSLPLADATKRDDRVPRDAQQSILLLPTSKVLVRSLTLPLAVEENLREVLAFEMDQHTPFTEDQVYYDYIVRNRNLERREVVVDLVYSPRREVDEKVALVAAQGVDVDVVTSRSRDGSNLRAVNLLPATRRRSRRLVIHRLNLALGGLCVVLAAVAVAIPIVQKDRALVELEAAVEAAAAEAREGNNIRRDLEKMAAASRFLYEKKNREVMAVQVIEEVSRILPDHTWLARLDISGDQVQMQGQSAASASLIALIEASPLFENAAFTSPVVQVAGTDADRFHISANVARSKPQ